MTYEIAKYLTDQEKAVAVTASYSSWHFRMPRTVSMQCPLGVAFQANDPGFRRCPTEFEVASYLARNGRIQPHQKHEVSQHAARFIEDWDSGKVTNLSEALGVQS